MKSKSKIYLLILIIIILILISYKIYAPYTIQDFNAVNVRNMDIIKNRIENEDYSFAVVGNIENSIAIFDNRILEKINQKNADFIISTGNNLRDGDESKYRVFYRTLEKLNIPFLTAIGSREIRDGGNENFYKYFGPFYYSFHINDSYFIFLDTTENTNPDWQQQWLVNVLEEAAAYDKKFVIMNKTPLKIDAEYLLDDSIKYIESADLRNFYQNIFAEYNVEAVFSSNLEIFHQENIEGVNYYVSGGAGGELIFDNKKSFYHYLLVNVTADGVDVSVERLESNPGTFSKLMVNIWVAFQSFFYANYINILLVLFIGSSIFYIFHREINKEVDYYRDFAYAEDEIKVQKLKIAMFTNNYFPVIGGVPISIQRLSKALRKRGHEVKIFAPEYKEQTENEENIIRCNSLYHYQESGLEFPVTNIYSPQIKKEFVAEDFDLVHAHHPFWLGNKGRKLSERFNLPLAFTYHTRLEKYAHYVPNILFMRKLFANRLSHFLIKSFANKTDAVFAPTESTKEYLRNVGVSRYIKVMPTGIDFDYYKCSQEKIDNLRSKLIGDSEHLLISVSRLSKEKNLYFILDGIKRLKEKSDLNFKLIIIGSGSEKESIERFIKDNDLENYIELIGAVDFKEMAKYYLASDLFVFASTTETQGMVLLEAMAGYNPVVAVKSSGIDDVIENDYNGYKTEEDIEKWSSRIEELLNNSDKFKQSSQNARKIAESYSIEEMGAKAEKLYYKILQLKKYQ
ncbi:glycosyltransferase involved in cell wall biosynthesis [Halanaerobium saccharolyticum]|uniref:Glycosyltransferase involved in cell wall biosynthesis n=1 Tax=Halanaerobium saccharolyticum TaxID=43595 RepID=A0A4R7YWZ7_9FIRM|nr:glycosyltransferase [Halanaerobium saccharolyticum]RAK05248.1 glycosyltransferase involved in cell wall biosynthesis [Halanaerobium saccharolyticum]TDV99613.1 glycosyltransferase involved in cell wall biosynthesis [Halanaerobium saccharolyticum]TDX51729.1 glycosyltransferase involved in cell wall biosynthesis [Halanaerobium saccharolyticum]